MSVGFRLGLPRPLLGRRGRPADDGTASRGLTSRSGALEGAVNGGAADGEDGRARLSYQQAAALFSEASGGATLHQLRHSALTHRQWTRPGSSRTGATAPLLRPGPALSADRPAAWRHICRRRRPGRAARPGRRAWPASADTLTDEGIRTPRAGCSGITSASGISYRPVKTLFHMLSSSRLRWSA
jgi:hypothetical protein